LLISSCNLIGVKGTHLQEIRWWLGWRANLITSLLFGGLHALTRGWMAVQGVSGPNAGKVGNQCLSGTFAFDLSGLNLANPMASTLNGN
jgi:hypothetical protein